MENLKEYIAIAAVVIPVVTAIVRWIWKLGSVQTVLEKTHHSQTINHVVNTSINFAEMWARKKDKPSSEEKKTKAMEFVKSAGGRLGIPQSLLDDEIISSYIEAALNKVAW